MTDPIHMTVWICNKCDADIYEVQGGPVLQNEIHPVEPMIEGEEELRFIRDVLATPEPSAVDLSTAIRMIQDALTEVGKPVDVVARLRQLCIDWPVPESLEGATCPNCGNVLQEGMRINVRQGERGYANPVFA